MNQGNHDRRGFSASVANVALIGSLAIGGYFLATEHRAHIATAVPYLPFLLILACPLLHIFMHGGQGGVMGMEASVAARRMVGILEVVREPMLALLLGGGVIYLTLGDLKEALTGPRTRALHLA